ncbi:MAG: CehA/McbA family metallohydrolase [Gemmatimonadota bacterium]|nr:CehA/McbA family metallohydrolase [Gemmatimonadota bacterium]
MRTYLRPPDGRHLAFSARGWIWIMDLESRTARQLTHGRDLDSRPAWHPSGNRLAIVRDNDHDTRIVVLGAESGEELRTIDSPALDLDPAYSPDGGTLYYVSGRAGTLDVWALDVASGREVPITAEPGIEMRPQPVPETDDVILLAKRGGDRVELRPHDGGEPRVLVSGSIMSMARPAVSPDGAGFVLGHPTQRGWDLRVHSVQQPDPSVLLIGGGLPLTPTWSADGRWIYFSEADDGEVMHLKRVAATGGPVEDVDVSVWQWRDETARLRIRTRMVGRTGVHPVLRSAQGSLAPARLSVVDESGHPAVPDHGAAHFDGANGRVFFYSHGLIEVTVPAGEVTVSAVQGLATPEATLTVTAAAGAVTEVELALTPVWEARVEGWASGDHHFHLNYGGQYDLDPADMVPKMAGEALDMATPLLANLHNRYEDQDFWGWEKSDGSPFIRFGQEIRSHFLGHIGLIEIPELYWPWVWGPGYEVYGRDDRTNAEVLEYAHGHGGMGFYVHPVSSRDPFSLLGRQSVPVELVADAVLGDVDALEIMCLWSSSEGTAALWHRLLNLGVTIAPSAGTDVMLNLYRTMAVGTTRVYAYTGAELNWPVYIEALREGRSFVTNGPFLELRVDGARPGGVVDPGPVSWSLDVATATEVDTVEILVNGRVVASRSGIASPGRRTYTGEIELATGGWIAARARGGETRWPSMDTEPYAHTAPVWIGGRGSTDPVALREAAQELLEVLIVARSRLRTGYAGASIPHLEARFDEAVERLETLAAPGREGRF